MSKGIIEKEFCPYEQALALKELRFNEPCLAFFWNTGKFYTCANYPHSINYHLQNQLGDYNYDSTSAPTYSQAFRWFREKYGLHYRILFGTKKYTYSILNERGILVLQKLELNISYEEAELECLKKLIEIVKEKLMSNLVEFRTNGLKCDNENCDWEDNTIPIEQFAYFVNACCPKCDEVLLTVEDFQSVIEVNTIVKMFNNMNEEQVKAFGMNPDPEAKKSQLNLRFKNGNIYEI